MAPIFSFSQERVITLYIIFQKQLGVTIWFRIHLFDSIRFDANLSEFGFENFDQFNK